MITVITVEGVLAKGDDLKSAQAHKHAKALYDGIRSQTNTFALTRADPEIAQWWLKREHLDGWSQVISFPGVMTWDHWRVDKVRDLLAESWEIMAYMDTNHYCCDDVRAMGVTAICVAYPMAYVGWKEQATTPRAWADVSQG